MKTPREVVEAFYHGFLNRDVDALCALYAEDAVNHQVAEEPVTGIEAIRQGFVDFFSAFPDETTTPINIYQDGEWGIWEWVGGNPSIKPVDGKTDKLHGCGFFQVKNGKIVLQRGYWDKLTFLKMHNLPLPQ